MSSIQAELISEEVRYKLCDWLFCLYTTNITEHRSNKHNLVTCIFGMLLHILVSSIELGNLLQHYTLSLKVLEDKMCLHDGDAFSLNKSIYFNDKKTTFNTERLF